GRALEPSRGAGAALDIPSWAGWRLNSPMSFRHSLPESSPRPPHQPRSETMDTLPPRPEGLTLDALIAAALTAGAEIMAVYAGDFAVVEKPDATPVTEADLRAEAVILARLAEAAPRVPVV